MPTFDSVETDNMQVKEDASIAGMLDVGQTATGALSIGAGYITFAGAPVASGHGFLLVPQPAPPASAEGATLFLDASTRKVMIRRAGSDGGGLITLG